MKRLFHHPQYALIDRTSDPYEEKNLAEDEVHRETFERLKTALHARLEALGDTDPIVTEKKIAGGRKNQGRKKKDKRKT